MVEQRRTRAFLLFGAMALVIAGFDGFIAANMVPVPEDEWLAYGIAADFMLVLPGLYAWLVLRRKGQPLTQALPIVGIGGIIAWLILPETLRSEAVWLKPAILATDALIVSWVGWKVLTLLLTARRVGSGGEDGAEALAEGVSKTWGSGKAASLLTHELTMIFYLFFSWGRSSKAGASSESFTYYKENTQILVASILTKVILFEGVVMHLLVMQWSHALAWILTAADAWLLLLIWGDCRASVLRPVRVEDGSLRLRYGLRIQADVPYDAIESIESAREYHPDKQEQRRAALPVLGTPNVRIRLRRELDVQGLLFVPRKVSEIYLCVDRPSEFAQAVQGRRHE